MSTFPDSKDLISLKYDHDKLHFVLTANTTNDLQRQLSTGSHYWLQTVQHSSSVSCKMLYHVETFDIKILHRNVPISARQREKADSFPALLVPWQPSMLLEGVGAQVVGPQLTCSSPAQLW